MAKTELKMTKMLKAIYHALDDKKAKDIVIIDVRHITLIADYFIFASGENYNQVQAMANSVEEEMAKLERNPRHLEGYQSANWILMDYNDIIVHIFYKEDRAFYDLDRIWKDGIRINLEDLPDEE